MAREQLFLVGMDKVAYYCFARQPSVTGSFGICYCERRDKELCDRSHSLSCVCASSIQKQYIPYSHSIFYCDAQVTTLSARIQWVYRYIKIRDF